MQRCEQLHPPTSRGACRPYASYRFLGHEESHDTQIMAGVDPFFNDHAEFSIVRSPDLEHFLRTAKLPITVFDDAAGSDAASSVVGVAVIEMANLATGERCASVILAYMHAY